VLSTLNTTLPLFALIGCGYAAGRFRVLSPAGIGGLNTFVYYFALPAMLFRVMSQQPPQEVLDLPFMGAWLVVELCVFGAALVGGWLVLRLTLPQSAVQALGGVFANSGYMGLPLITTLLGQGAVVPVALTMVVDLTVMTALTIVLIEVARRGGGGLPRALGVTLRAALLNPFVLSIWAGMAFAATSWELQAGVFDFLGVLGSAATPCALFAIGGSLVGRNTLGSALPVSTAVIMKLAVHPLLAAGVLLYWLPAPGDWAMAAVLVAALPTAGTVYVIAQRYGVFVAQASATILYSTVAGVVTFTLISFALLQ